jgi:hypothetical protein
MKEEEGKKSAHLIISLFGKSFLFFPLSFSRLLTDPIATSLLDPMGTLVRRLVGSFNPPSVRKSTSLPKTSVGPISSFNLSYHRTLHSYPVPTTLLFAVSVIDSRSYSTQSMESTAESSSKPTEINTDFCDFLSYASSHGPGFRVDPNSIEIVRDPSSFFNELMVCKAENSLKAKFFYQKSHQIRPLTALLLGSIRLASNQLDET